MTAEDTRIILFGLLDGCPFEFDENCPIKDIRRLPDKKKQAWARGLSLEEVDGIIAQQERCF